MRTLVSFLTGLGLGFLASREYDRLISEKARLQAVENKMAGAPGMMGFPPEPPDRPAPHPAEQLEEKTITCEVCTETWTEELPPMEQRVKCPSCGKQTSVDG